MQKKTLVIATGLVISSPLYASDISFYAGGAVQNNRLEMDYDLKSSNPYYGTSGHDTAVGLKIFSGVKKRAGSGFYGIEAAYESGNSETSASLSKLYSSTWGELEDNASFSLSLLGGIEVYKNTYLTGRVGYIRTDFDYRALDGDGSTTVSKGDDALSGAQYAIGVEHHYSNNIGIRLEYSISDYSDDIGTVATGTGDLALFDDITREAISLGVFVNFY